MYNWSLSVGKAQSWLICRAEPDEHYQRCRDILPHTLSLSKALWLVATSTIVHSWRLIEPISYTRVASDTDFSINAGYIVAGTETLHLRVLCPNNLSLFMSAWAESLPALRFSRAHSLCAPTLPCAWQSLSRNALPGSCGAGIWNTVYIIIKFRQSPTHLHIPRHFLLLPILHRSRISQFSERPTDARSSYAYRGGMTLAVRS